MTSTDFANAQRQRTAPAFRVDNRGILRFITGERARAAEIQSTSVSIRRNTGSTFPLWMGWLVAGLIVNGTMGAANNGKDYNDLQGLLSGTGLLGGPAAILAYRNRKGVFVDVEGSGSLITSIHMGNHNPENEAKAYALADEVIEAAEDLA
jgi:hypothetical protein